MTPFSLLIKPTSADCNLRCRYCFYLDHAELYPETKRHRMSDEVLEKLISSYMATFQPKYLFSWQGGEPTLMGIDFFRKVNELQQKYGTYGSSIGNGMQTNATMINDELAEHLKKYNWLVGVSIDGVKDIHDHYRKTVDGRGSNDAVLKGLFCLKRHGVDFNVLVLVNNINVRKGKETYRYLRDMGCTYLQFIPCVEFDEKNQPLEYTVSPDDWGQFLCDVYDEWLKKDVSTVSVRLFDAVLNKEVKGVNTICRMGDNCCQYFCVEYNGDVYPCDFFVAKEWKLGSLMKDSWEELLASKRYAKFGKQKKQWNKSCSGCDVLDYCMGDCLKYRIYNGNTPEKLSWLCVGWQRFYRHALPGLKKIAEKIKARGTA